MTQDPHRQPFGGMPPELVAGIAAALMVVVGAPFYAVYKHFYPDPPPPSIEQIREARDERFNAAGKSVNEFLRGAAGIPSNAKPTK